MKIQTKRAQLEPFVLNRAQRRVWESVKSDLEAGRPVRKYILKARQLGFSTLIQALAYWWVSLRANQTAMVAAHEDEAASSLFQKSNVFYRMVPEELRPMVRLNNRRELHFANPDVRAKYEEMGLESRIVVRTANNRNLGASLTCQFLHLSEFAKYERVLREVKTAMATVLQTVPRLPETFVFLETTADGMGFAKTFWDDDNGYEKIFISWVADEEYTASECDLRFEDLYNVDDSPFGDETQVRLNIIHELHQWYQDLVAERGTEWVNREALCRLQWRREVIKNQFHGDLALFAQEYPVTAEEAFLTSGRSVFPQRELKDVKDALHGGEGGALTYVPRTYRFDFQRRDFYAAKNGPLRLYEMPRKGSRYVIGADVAEGYEGPGDFSVAQVLRLPELVQVAVYEDSDIDPDDFAEVLRALGRRFNFAHVCVETNGPGLSTSLKLSKRERRYPNLYHREVLDTQSKKYVRKWGWHSNRSSKPVLIHDLRAAIRSHQIIFRDVKTLDDLCVFVQHPNGSVGAMHGEHDDTVISLGLAIQMASQLGPRYASPVSGRHTPGTLEYEELKARRRNRPKSLTRQYYEERYF